jgi:hypothetical protein
MSVNISRWPSYIPTFSNLRQSKNYQNWDFWIESKPSGNPWGQFFKRFFEPTGKIGSYVAKVAAYLDIHRICLGSKFSHSPPLKNCPQVCFSTWVVGTNPACVLGFGLHFVFGFAGITFDGRQKSNGPNYLTSVDA